MTSQTAQRNGPDAVREEEDAYRADLTQATTELNLDTARALCRLSDSWGSRLTPGHPAYPLLTRLTRDLVNAGFAVHDCASRARTGGVCLTAPTDEQAGVIVTWTPHHSLAIDNERYEQASDVGDLMNFVLADVLCALGWQANPYGQSSAHIVIGRLEAGTADHG